jgi:acetyl esterase/lipase
VAGLVVSCTSSADEARPGDGVEGESARAVEDPDPTDPPEPDVLADPGVEPGTCEIVTYGPDTAEDAKEGQLCRPERQRDVAVVLIHGGGGTSGGYQNLEGWSRRLLAEGYVTFLPAYHLFRPGSGESPVFPRPEQDVKAALQYVRGTGNALGIDKERIVVQGHSAGARLGAVAFTTPDDPAFAGPELHAGISDRANAFVGFYHPYDGTMQNQGQYYGGEPTSDDPEVAERWSLVDALSRAADADGPALLVTGEDDWSLIEDHQDLFADELEDDGQEARTVVVEGGAHGFDLGGVRLTRLGERAATEVLEFLNDVFPQDPARPAQADEVDLTSSPTAVGSAPTTAATRVRRPQATTTTTRYRGASTTVWTSPAPTVAPTAPPETATVPPTTSPPPTDPPPTAPPTSLEPPPPVEPPTGGGDG